jgi:hypothetical protein
LLVHAALSVYVWPPIANADVVRIAKIDTLKASKLLAGWREQGLLVPLPGRGKRNMAAGVVRGSTSRFVFSGCRKQRRCS